MGEALQTWNLHNGLNKGNNVIRSSSGFIKGSRFGFAGFRNGWGNIKLRFEI